MVFLKESWHLTKQNKTINAKFLHCGWTKRCKNGLLQRDSYCNLFLLCSTWKYQKFTSMSHEYLWEGGSICQHLLLFFFFSVLELVGFCLFYWLNKNWWNGSSNGNLDYCNNCFTQKSRLSFKALPHLVNLWFCAPVSNQMFCSTSAGITYRDLNRMCV